MEGLACFSAWPLHHLGVDDKTIQSILRHEDITNTQNLYVKGISEDARRAMDKLDQQITLMDSKRTAAEKAGDEPLVM